MELERIFMWNQKTIFVTLKLSSHLHWAIVFLQIAKISKTHHSSVFRTLQNLKRQLSPKLKAYQNKEYCLFFCLTKSYRRFFYGINGIALSTFLIYCYEQKLWLSIILRVVYRANNLKIPKCLAIELFMTGQFKNIEFQMQMPSCWNLKM